MNRHAALGGALILAGLALLLLVGCATTDPEIVSALEAYDRAAALGLVRERIERPSARLTDGAPWSRARGVEVAR